MDEANVRRERGVYRVLRQVLRRLFPHAQQGQSLTEISLFTPLLLLGLVGAANLGLALEAHTRLAQATQQTAQYLLNHPAATDASASTADAVHTACTSSTQAYTDCTEDVAAAFLQRHGYTACVPAYQAPSDPMVCAVSVSFTHTSSGVQTDTLYVQYPFPLAIPVPAGFSAAALHGHSLDLGATVTTIASAGPPANTVTTH
jgi:Flp pilus assembly protein TadG